MIDAISNQSRPAANAKTAAANAAQGSFQSALASKVTEPQDTLQISGMSDWPPTQRSDGAL